MKDLKKIKYLILDMDGCVYHPKYLKTLFSQVSAKMTEFISLKLDIDKIKSKEIICVLNKSSKELISFVREKNLKIAYQNNPKGTGDAVQVALNSKKKEPVEFRKKIKTKVY